MSQPTSQDPADVVADVVLVGAGPNGMALALALAGSQASPKCRVVLIDAKDLRNGTATPDSRGSAITKATQNFLRALGCWQTLAPHAAEMRRIAVTDGRGTLDSRPVLLSFATAEDETAAASILENTILHASLRERVLASPNIDICAPATIAAITSTNGQSSVTLADGRTITAPLLVGADGRNSIVRQTAGIATEQRDDGQAALTFAIGHRLPHHNRAEEHFTPTGVIALLPLPGEAMSLVWGTSQDEADRLMALSPLDFDIELNQQIGSHLGEITLKGQRQCYPLRRQWARSLTAHRVALVGDAAHTIHPLAGLGLNLGFKDAACLADCVLEAMARGEDWGAAGPLARYETWRRFEVASTALVMEAISATFVNTAPALATLRRAGLFAADKIAPLKSALMQEATGLNGDLPRLMR